MVVKFTWFQKKFAQFSFFLSINKFYLKIDVRHSVFLLKGLLFKDYVHQKVQSIKWTSIKHSIYSKLLIILSIYTEQEQLQRINTKDFPLHKDRYFYKTLYTSGVVLRLSKYENITVCELAEAIASYFSANYSNEFKVKTVFPGWLHFELTASALASWLQSLAEEGAGEQGEQGKQGEQGEKEIFIPGEENSLFSVQYAHARCGSLLRLGKQEGLIDSSNCIPWLDSNKELRLTDPASTRLIDELIQVVDFSECNNSAKWEKVALKLSQAFETFWSQCRIFGQVKTTSPELAGARLGLVMATQSVLSFLLETKLGISAPEEL